MPIHSGEEKVRCDLLTLLKYGINISEEKVPSVFQPHYRKHCWKAFRLSEPKEFP